MSKTTMLGETQLTQSPHDIISIELIRPDDLPAIVRIVWPLQPTVLDPKRFGEVAAVIVRLFSTAHVTLARIRSGRL